MVEKKSSGVKADDGQTTGARGKQINRLNARQQFQLAQAIVEHRERLWTFLEVDGVAPTNNAAEQALRHAVIWRKLSFGTQSADGSRFVERMLTVIETCRRQQRNVFTWLTDTVSAHYHGRPTPSLLLAA